MKLTRSGQPAPLEPPSNVQGAVVILRRHGQVGNPAHGRIAPVVNANRVLYYPEMPPIVACHTNSYGHLGGAAAIEGIRAAGLEYVEFPIRRAGFRSRTGAPPLVTTESTLAGLRSVERLLEGHGVRVASCTCMAGNPLQEAVVAVMRRQLDMASHFGVKFVVADAGAAGDDDELARIYANLNRIGDYAAKLGITVCFETHHGLCVNHREMRQIMADLAHPNLQLNFDTGNIVYYNEDICGEVALAKVCHLVKHLHLKDSSGRFADWNFPALGSGGGVDFLRVYQIMRDCGFRGPYSIEIEGIADEPELSLAAYQQRVVESVEYLRTLGYFDG
ncbi:MAG: sugar phosphate isomerase/epimerase family protein [Deltaproteobacteria bacterium]